MIHLDNFLNTWPSLLYGGLIGFISGRLLKGLEFAREHRGVREQILSLLCRIEESAKRASNSKDIESLSATCTILRERIYSGECATGLLGTRSLNALYDDFTAIDALVQEAVGESCRDSSRTLDIILSLGARAAVARYRLRDTRPIRIIRNSRDAVRTIDYAIFFGNVVMIASFGAFILSLYLTSLLHRLSVPIIGSFVLTFSCGAAMLTWRFLNSRSHAFAAKLISERVSGRRIAMRIVVGVLAYFGLAATAVATFEWFVLVTYRPAFNMFGAVPAFTSQAVLASLAACILIALLVMSIRYGRALREEQRVIEMASLNGVCRDAPRSIYFGGKSLCGCSPAECISRRLAL